MRITKYPQSCLVVEREGRIVIDPGNITLDAFGVEDLGHLDAVLYTHRHPDHYDERHVADFIERGAAIYGNADVAGLIGDGTNQVEDGETIEVAGFTITPRDLAHVELVDGSPGPPNTGYLIDDRLFHPGDGIELPGLRAQHLALPIVGPSISFRDAYVFTEATGAETVIPVHYDMFTADPHLFDRFCDIAEVVVLDHGESVEL